MATYGGNSVIKTFQTITVGDPYLDNGFIGTIYTAPADCLESQIKFVAYENIGSELAYAGFSVQIQAQTTSNLAWIDQASFSAGNPSAFFGNGSVPLNHSNPKSIIASGRVVSSNAAQEYAVSDQAGLEFKLFPGERIRIALGFAPLGSPTRIMLYETLVKLSSGA